MKFLRWLGRTVLELLILIVLLGIWANITVDKVSQWVDADECEGMAIQQEIK